MLDLSGIPVVDNHCHPVLLKQRMDVLEFRSYWTEASHPSLVQQHVSNSVYYLWLLRQVAGIYGSGRAEDTVVTARNSMQPGELLQHLLQSAYIDTLILDVGHPVPEICFSPEQMGQLGRCQAVKLLRLETVMQDLVVECADFDEMVDRFSLAVSNVRERGYCGFKSIVAYRTGLDIAEWSKDQAAASFAQARQEAAAQGTLRIAHKPLIDYLLHLAFARAAEQALPIQFHTGYGDSDADMRLGNPLHLRAVLERNEYQGMSVVLLHESYPYTQLGAYLAAVYPHVYFDLSYTIPFVDRLEMLAFTRQALSVAPASKLLYSSDGIYLPEMHWAGALRGRKVIAQVLQEMIAADELDEAQALHLAQQILHDTAYRLYKLQVRAG